MYSTPTLNDSMTGYYNSSLDYQSNLINGVNTNIYSNANSFIKHSPPSHSPLSEDESNKRKRSKGHRNTRKVMIEKKRRDRINLCLDELRKLVPAANEKQGSAKLEKAEILQMTVDHLKNLHSKGFDTFSFEPHTFATKHLVIGFRECAEQVTRHLSSAEGFAFNEPLKLRLISHLQRYITQREYDLKSNSANGLAWNPNLFLLPPTTTTNQPSINNNVNTTSSLSANTQQMLNSTTSLSPITTLTHSSLSSHSNSSITSNSSSYQQQVNQQNDSTPTSPLCESPVPNNSLNTSQLTASQLLNQHSYTDNNNNTSTSSSSSQNASLHSDSTSSINQTNQLSNVSNAINNAINSINTNDDTQSSLLLMGPPPPRPFKVVNLPLNGASPHSPNISSSELTYTNMQPSPTYSSHHHHSINTNGYATNSLPNTFSNSLSNSYLAASVAHHSNQIHHHSPYLNNFSSAAFAYGSVGQTMNMSGASVVPNVVSLPNHSAGQSSSANQQYSATTKSSYVRPWGSDNMVKIAY